MNERPPIEEATLSDLVRADGKAELVDGTIVSMPPAGDDPGHGAFEIAASLREHARRTGHGRVVPDGVGFVVDLPNRRSFCPDAAFWTGPRGRMQLLSGAPAFAVELRNEHDYGPAAERAMAAKRADYFAAGTRTAWDVDLLDPVRTVRSYRADSPAEPVTFGRGETAHAGDAVPGWSIVVDELFLDD